MQAVTSKVRADLEKLANLPGCAKAKLTRLAWTRRRDFS
jgi:hypothetical protein